MAIRDDTRENVRQGWNAFCDALRAKGEELVNGTIETIDEQELAEGLRYLAATAVHALQLRLEFADPDFPRFFRLLDDRIRPGGPNVDNSYFTATIDGDATYRITGNTYGRDIFISGLWSFSPEFEHNDDGTFEVTLSAQPKPGNWAPLQPGYRGDRGVPDLYPGISAGTLIRVYYNDWDDESPPAKLHIERVDDGAPLLPESLTPERIGTQIREAASLFEKSVNFWERHIAVVRDEYEVNTLTSPPSSRAPEGIAVKLGVPPRTSGGPGPSLVYSFGWYQLEPEQALLIEVDEPDARYWGIQIYNRWFEAPDLQTRQTSINGTQAHVDDDGRVRVVIARRDPGCPNWLDTSGNARGQMWYRLLGPRTLPEASCRVLSLATLREHLPTSHPTTGDRERREQLAKRHRHLATRFQA